MSCRTRSHNSESKQVVNYSEQNLYRVLLQELKTLLSLHSMKHLLAKEGLQKDERGRVIRIIAAVMIEKFGPYPSAEHREIYASAMNHLFPKWDQV